jgi:hypothetical protein
MATLAVAAVAFAGQAEAQFIGYPQWQEQFRDGNCLIKRKQEKGGAYKEEIRCNAPSPPVTTPKFSEEYTIGNCKVLRWQETNGESFFARDCKDPG